MLLVALSAGVVIGTGCAAKSTTATPGAPPDVETTDNAHWTTNIQPVMQNRGDVAQSTRDRSYGNFTWGKGASPSLTNYNIVFNYAGQERFLSWAIVAGSCGTPALPILPASNFSELNVGSGGRSQANGTLPLDLPTIGSYHVDVYRSRTQGLDTLVGCGNLKFVNK
jgi:hypothetical protein